MKPWKRPPPANVNDPVVTLQWGHGGEAVEETTQQANQLRMYGLQWGHGDEAVEEDLPTHCMVNRPDASMGPRR